MTDRDEGQEKVFFVSRRGRQVGIHQLDLSDVDIEHDELASQSPKPVTRQKTRATATPSRPRTGWTKKKAIVLAVTIAVLSMPLVAGELVAAQYHSGISGARKDLALVVNKTVLPAQKKTSISADQIRSAADQVNDIVGHMCRGGLLDNAASLYPRAQTALSDCKASQTLYAALASNLYTLESQARYLERVDGFIKPVATPITDAYAVIGAQQTLWQAAADGIKKLSAPEQMKAAHLSLSTHVDTVAAAWSALNTANNGQDAAGFTDAEQKLATEYEAVRASSSEFITVLAATQTKIMLSYNLLK